MASRESPHARCLTRVAGLDSVPLLNAHSVRYAPHSGQYPVPTKQSRSRAQGPVDRLSNYDKENNSLLYTELW